MIESNNTNETSPIMPQTSDIKPYKSKKWVILYAIFIFCVLIFCLITIIYLGGKADKIQNECNNYWIKAMKKVCPSSYDIADLNNFSFNNYGKTPQLNMSDIIK